MSDGSPAHTIDSVQDRVTPLCAAAYNGHVKAVEVLIAAKTKTDIQAKVRFTACLLVIIWMCTEWSHSIAYSQ